MIPQYLIFKINELLLLCPLLGFEFPSYYWSLTNTCKSMKVGRKMQMNDERKLIFSIDNVVQKNTIVEEFANHKVEEKKEIDSNKQSTR
jgi:hypothetical protein